MAHVVRTIQLKVLVTPEERKQLAEVALHQGLTASDVVRQIIRKQHAKLCDQNER